ncbi:MAG: hypothetical protein R3D30_14085 [Hyphomicrobiales bacterium]
MRLEDGRHLAVKARERGRAQPRTRRLMLSELERLSALPVPHVHHAAPDLLVIDFIDNDGGPITAHVERHAAEAARGAARDTTRDVSGYARDTLIAPAPAQPETPALDPVLSATRASCIWPTRRAKTAACRHGSMAASKARIAPRRLSDGARASEPAAWRSVDRQRAGEGPQIAGLRRSGNLLWPP